MSLSIKRRGWLVLALAAIPAAALLTARASDHADTVELAQNPAFDLTDVFMFPSATNPNNVVLAMTVSPLIPAGQAGSRSFSPDCLYQFKLDTNGDAIEDRVIQATFQGTGGGQQVTVVGPVAPNRIGTENELMSGPVIAQGSVNTNLTGSGGTTVFAGPRSDPFFFDLERFFQILPDRATPITGVPDPTPNTPKAASWRAPGAAQDFLANYNVLAIVVELPKTQIGNGVVGLWCTTSR